MGASDATAKVVTSSGSIEDHVYRLKDTGKRVYPMPITEFSEDGTTCKDLVSFLSGSWADEYAAYIKGLGLSGNNTVSDIALMSRTVKAYMNDRYEGKKMFDSVSGATISASGISAATKEATHKSASDYKTNSDVKDISIIEPKTKTVEVNRGDSVDFSELKVKIVKKDGSVKEAEWKDFAASGLSIADEDGKAIENGSDLKSYGDKKIIKAKVIHKQSLSYDNFRILVGRYSKDYIVGLEYSKDG